MSDDDYTARRKGEGVAPWTSNRSLRRASARRLVKLRQILEALQADSDLSGQAACLQVGVAKLFLYRPIVRLEARAITDEIRALLHERRERRERELELQAALAAYSTLEPDFAAYLQRNRDMAPDPVFILPGLNYPVVTA